MSHSTSPPRPRQDIYKLVTERVIALLEQGTIPWKKPWRGGASGMPRNAISKKPYRGVNVFLLTVTAEAMGYNSSYWVTYKQAQTLGGNVRKGEKATPIVFWKWLDVDKTNSKGETTLDKIPMLRQYAVFNADQCENVHIPGGKQEFTEPLDFEPISACENIVEHMPKAPLIKHSGQSQAFYRPSADFVHMPNKEQFNGVQEYYSTLFHELTHATGHKSRLDRFQDNQAAAFGSEDYSKEELIAEMGAAFLCGFAEIATATIDNSSAYIRGWLRELRNDKKLVVLAAAKAQKAVDFILGEPSQES